MGVCLGKDAPLGSDALDPDGRFNRKLNDNPDLINGGDSKVKKMLEVRTPVIFVLGGPGSGKITHCDRVVQERTGLAHINMTDLIQQHLVGNGLQEFGLIPPSNLIEVLQMEMKMAVNSRGFLISGYPRSMRDVVEYQNKLSRIDNVILLNWHIRILEKQIEYGSQLGDTVLQLARMELKNYSKNVLAVAEYFDQMGKLIVVDGERQPTEVYLDFVQAVDGTVNNISTGDVNVLHNKSERSLLAAPLGAPVVGGNYNNRSMNNNSKVIFVIGGPGSNKSLLSSTSIKLHHSDSYNWLSVGQELRKLTETNISANNMLNLSSDKLVGVKNNLAKGELVNNDIVIQLLASFINNSKKHFLIDGFPRNLQQVQLFQDKLSNVKPPPPCILVDCSELELGRSLGQRAKRNEREDDQNSSAVKKRLEIYRTITLPTLKILDDQHRLHIIDGDVEDKGKIVEEFNSTLGSIIDAFDGKRAAPMNNNNINSNNKLLSVAAMAVDKRKPSTDTINGMYNEVQQNSE